MQYCVLYCNGSFVILCRMFNNQNVDQFLSPVSNECVDAISATYKHPSFMNMCAALPYSRLTLKGCLVTHVGNQYLLWFTHQTLIPLDVYMVYGYRPNRWRWECWAAFTNLLCVPWWEIALPLSDTGGKCAKVPCQCRWEGARHCPVLWEKT